MDIDWKDLAEKALKVAHTAAPLIGMSDELAAAEALAGAVVDLVGKVKDIAPNDNQADLQAGLDEVMAALNAHAERTKASLG